jgi:hypothetical protein
MRSEDLESLLLFVWNFELHVSHGVVANIENRLDRHLKIAFGRRLNHFVGHELGFGMCAPYRFERGDALPNTADALKDNVAIDQECGPLAHAS